MRQSVSCLSGQVPSDQTNIRNASCFASPLLAPRHAIDMFTYELLPPPDNPGKALSILKMLLHADDVEEETKSNIIR